MRPATRRARSRGTATAGGGMPRQSRCPRETPASGPRPPPAGWPPPKSSRWSAPPAAPLCEALVEHSGHQVEVDPIVSDVIEALQGTAQDAVVVVQVVVALVIVACERPALLSEEFREELLVERREEQVAAGRLPVEHAVVHVARILFERAAAEAVVNDPGQIDADVRAA